MPRELADDNKLFDETRRENIPEDVNMHHVRYYIVPLEA